MEGRDIGRFRVIYSGGEGWGEIGAEGVGWKSRSVCCLGW